MTATDELDLDVVSGAREQTRRHSLRPEHSPRHYAAWAVLGVATALWLLSLPKVAGAGVSQWGLMASGSKLFAPSMCVTVIGFVIAARRHQPGAALAATFVMAAQQRLTITLGTAVPYYSWTYKHLAVVDYIQQHGTVARDVDIYQNWPGLFSATAWFCDVTGLNPMTIAHWYTPVLHVALIMTSIALARAWGANQMTALAAAFIMETLNWVGQDYFSPQATAFLISMGVLTLIGHCRHKPVAIPLLLVLFTAIVVTHQLTPFWLILVSILLILRRSVQPRWLPIALIGITGLYLLLNWKSAGQYSLLSFNPLANAQSNIPTIGVFGQRVTSFMVRALAVGVWGVAALAAWFMRKRPQFPALGLFFLTFSSFLLLAGQGYGGEAIFRVFLYSLPGTSMVLAPVLIAASTARLRVAVPTAVVGIGVTMAAAMGVYGSWSAYRMTKDEVQVSTALLNQATFPSYLTPAALVWPERNGASYVRFARWNTEFDETMVEYADLVGSDFDSDADYQKFDKAAAARTGGPTYLIITKQMISYGWYFGGLPLSALPNLYARMQRDPEWQVVYRSTEIQIFRSRTATTK